MVACGDVDGAVTGNTRRFGASLDKIKQVVEARSGEIMFGLNLVVHKEKQFLWVIQVFMNTKLRTNGRNGNFVCKGSKIIWI